MDLEIQFLKLKKEFLRAETLQKRNALTQAERDNLSDEIYNSVVNNIISAREVENILLYANISSEVKTDKIINYCLDNNINLFLPRVKDSDIDFYKITSINDLEVGFKDIPEPTNNCIMKDDWDTNTIIIIPGSVFSKAGYRLGYGKGYYDKYLAKHNNLYKVGICYECQLLEYVPNEEHDVRLDVIITNKRIIKTN